MACRLFSSHKRLPLAAGGLLFFLALSLFFIRFSFLHRCSLPENWSSGGVGGSALLLLIPILFSSQQPEFPFLLVSPLRAAFSSLIFLFFWPLHSVMGLVPCRVFFFNSCVSRYHPQFLFVRSQEVEEGDEQAGKKRKGERSSEGEFSAIAFACCIHLRVGFSGFYFCTFCVFPHEPV